MQEVRDCHGADALKARIELHGTEVTTDLSRPLHIGLSLDFTAQQPRHFGAPAAATAPFAAPGFSGSVASGASCNCHIITLTPHCNGTHTECVGHLTAEAFDAHRQIPAGLVPALLVTVTPVRARESAESSDPAPLADDWLITRMAIERNWPAKPAFTPRALVVRTRSTNSTDPPVATTPFLSRDAAELMVARGIEHLVIDLPSLDRTQDQGRLSAHRVFFGLPPGSTALAAARRPQATVTELASIPAAVEDGLYLLEIQAPAIGGDAVPSRPLLYRIEPA